MAFTRGHWIPIRTNNAFDWHEPGDQEAARVIGNCPGGRSTLMLVSIRLSHVAATQWGSRRRLGMDKLENQIPREEALEMVGQDSH